MKGDQPELLLIMPVFNEQAPIRKVVREWFFELENWTEKFCILAIDDGSTDGSLDILRRLQDQLGERLEVVSRPNKGHGVSCIEGYRVAIERGIPWVFQVDSDGQCDPQYFFRLWRKREQFDVIYGWRRVREDGLQRVVASFILKGFLMAVAGVSCVDANTPYRLMKVSKIAPHVRQLETVEVFLANVALAVLLKRDRSIRQGEVPIRFRERYGGEPSVKLSRFAEKAGELRRQLKQLLSA